MKSIQQRWFEGPLLLCLIQSSLAFTGVNQLQRNRAALKAIVDPNDIISAASHVKHTTDFQALLTTMVSATIKPVQEHAEPLYPRKDTMTLGEFKALADLGAKHVTSAKELFPTVSAEFQKFLDRQISEGWLVMDYEKIADLADKDLPGKTAIPDSALKFNSVQSPRGENLSLATLVKVNLVFEHVPLIAIVYAFIEFFIVRPGIGLYKEDIEDEPSFLREEFISVTIVRATILGALLLGLWFWIG